MEKAKRIPTGALTMVLSGAMYALLSFFIANYTLILCAVWVTNLNSLAQLNHYHHSLLPPPLFAIRLPMMLIILVSMKSRKRLVEYLAAVHLKELNADKEASGVAAITSAREETA